MNCVLLCLCLGNVCTWNIPYKKRMCSVGSDDVCVFDVDLQMWPMSPDSRHSPRDENNTVARSRYLLLANDTNTERAVCAYIPKP